MAISALLFNKLRYRFWNSKPTLEKLSIENIFNFSRKRTVSRDFRHFASQINEPFIFDPIIHIAKVTSESNMPPSPPKFLGEH
jgi:hypothetical protein